MLKRNIKKLPDVTNKARQIELKKKMLEETNKKIQAKEGRLKTLKNIRKKLKKQGNWNEK